MIQRCEVCVCPVDATNGVLTAIGDILCADCAQELNAPLREPEFCVECGAIVVPDPFDPEWRGKNNILTLCSTCRATPPAEEEAIEGLLRILQETNEG